MLSYVLIQVIMVLSIPVFTKLLTPSDFGIYEVYNNTVRFLAVIISLNLYTGFYRYYFEEHLDKRALMQFLLRLALIAFITGSIILIIIKNQLLGFTGLPGDVFFWILTGIFSAIVFNFFTNYSNAQQFSNRLGLWQLINQLLRVSGAIVFVLFISKNYYGRIVGENIALLAVALILCVVYFRNYFGLKESLPDKKQIVLYSAGFIPIGLSSYIVSYIDLVLINKIQGSTETGVYSYAYKFAIIYSGFSMAFVTANRPNLFNLLNEKKSEEVIGQMRSMFKLITVLSSFFILFAADAGKILSLKKEFDVALHLLPVLVLAYVFSDIAEVYNFFLYYSKKVKLFYVSFATTAVLNFLLNWFLIPIYGYEVAAYTTLLSFFVLFVATYIVCKFFTNLTIPRWTVFGDYILLLFFIIGLVYLFNYLVVNFWILVIIKLLLFGLLVLLLFFDKLKNITKLLK